jgi:hypothetical protein
MIDNPVWEICEGVAEVHALLDDHNSAAEVVATAQAVLSEAELLRAKFDVGYFPPNRRPSDKALRTDGGTLSLPTPAKQTYRAETGGEKPKCAWQWRLRQEAQDLATRKLGGMDIEICFVRIQSCKQRGFSICDTTFGRHEGWIVSAGRG